MKHFVQLILFFLIGYFITVITYRISNSYLHSKLKEDRVSNKMGFEFYEQESKNLAIKYFSFYGKPEQEGIKSAIINIIMNGSAEDSWKKSTVNICLLPYMKREYTAQTNIDILKSVLSLGNSLGEKNTGNHFDEFEKYLSRKDFKSAIKNITSDVSKNVFIKENFVRLVEGKIHIYNTRDSIVGLDNLYAFNVKLDTSKIEYMEYVNQLNKKRSGVIQSFAKSIDATMTFIRKSQYFKWRIYLNGPIQFWCVAMFWSIFIMLTYKFTRRWIQRTDATMFLENGIKPLSDLRKDSIYHKLLKLSALNVIDYNNRISMFDDCEGENKPTMLDWYTLQKDNFLSEISDSYDLEKNLISLIAILGFVGTVSGILETLPESSKVFTNDGIELKKALSQEITFSLGVAFDTTLIALILSFVLMFVLYVFSFIESKLTIKFLEKCEHRHLYRNPLK